MPENYRRFSVNDPFGRTWDVEFRWQQNAISIRHADAIDCKYYISAGEERRGRIGRVAALSTAGASPRPHRLWRCCHDRVSPTPRLDIPAVAAAGISVSILVGC